MKLLELFSGTKSVGKVAENLGYEVVSLDLKNADINCNIIFIIIKSRGRGHHCYLHSALLTNWWGWVKNRGLIRHEFHKPRSKSGPLRLKAFPGNREG